MIKSSSSNTRRSYGSNLAESLSWNYGQQTVVDSVVTADSSTFPPNEEIEQDNTWETTSKSSISPQEKESLIESADYLKKQRTRDIQGITDQLREALRKYAFDDETMEPAWHFLDSIVDVYPPDYFGESFQGIFILNNSEINCMCGLCKCLISFDFDEVFPWGQSILVGLLNHRNETVKEYAVSLLDNWKRTELVDLLKNLEIKSNWMREYVVSVIRAIEK